MQGVAQPITVLLVDDHEVVRMGLQSLFKRVGGIVVVGEAGTGREAVEAVRRLTPAVVLLDLRLPDANGIEVCREILEIVPACKVLFLTSYVDEEAAMATILAGAKGYLLKDVLGEELVRAIEQVAAGQSVLDPALTARVLALLQSPNVSAGPNPPHPLSLQEQQMMTLIVEGKTNKDIGVALGLSDKTVRNLLTSVFKKLGARRRSQAAVVYSKQYSSSIPD
ncbi:MAG: response regulator transcription factor [Nitrospirae bacterium]|nr:response regulator transcription factor [Nitrospirota bacterium]